MRPILTLFILSCITKTKKTEKLLLQALKEKPLFRFQAKLKSIFFWTIIHRLTHTRSMAGKLTVKPLLEVSTTLEVKNILDLLRTMNLIGLVNQSQKTRNLLESLIKEKNLGLANKARKIRRYQLNMVINQIQMEMKYKPIKFLMKILRKY